MKAYSLIPVPTLSRIVRFIADDELAGNAYVCVLAEVDLTQVERVRAAYAQAARRKPSYTSFVMKAVGMALREFPQANRRVVKRWWWPFGLRCQQFEHADIAVAIEREEPDQPCVVFQDVVRDADAKSLGEIVEQLNDLATSTVETNRQWREFRWIGTRLPFWLARLVVGLPVRMPSLWAKYRGGSVMVSSPAKYGADQVTGAWPYTLGVSFGHVKERPVVQNGELAVARTTFLTLSFDRRILAGATAARLFNRIVGLLENAAEWGEVNCSAIKRSSALEVSTTPACDPTAAC